MDMPLQRAADAAHEFRMAQPRRRTALSRMAGGAVSSGTISLSQIQASGLGHCLTRVPFMETRGHVVDGRIGHHQVTLKAGFRLATEEKGGNNAGDKQEKGAIRIVAGRA